VESDGAERGKNAPVKIRLDPADEYMHALEDASNFNESMYFNVFDRAGRTDCLLDFAGLHAEQIPR
jgi:hypothetical protein